ncbi:MAG: DUF4113 domain-containing protein [Chromatiaceae bacterium]|nr:DUF4113 domain-containing protein [Chromatiaceae bacterium]
MGSTIGAAGPHRRHGAAAAGGAGGPGAHLSGRLSLPARRGGVAGPEPGGGADRGAVRAGGGGTTGAAARGAGWHQWPLGAGDAALSGGGWGWGQTWRMRRERLSPGYTTDWGGLMEVG